jgi:hypothetical protein
MDEMTTTCTGCEVTSAYLRDALEAIARAAGVPSEADYGPKANGLLLDDILVALGRPEGEGARL